MTDFKTIFGKNIRLQTSDLTMSTATEGELFYSDTDKEFKVGINVNAWASGGNMNQARRSPAGCGTQTAGMAFGGFSGSTALALCEEYNGSAWSEVADFNTARGKIGSASAGTQTAALAFGGASAEPSNPDIVGIAEEWDGSSWTESGDLNTARYSLSGAGTQTAGLGYGGYITGTSINNSEEYNGTSWTEGDNLGTAKSAMASFGTQTAAVAALGTDDSTVQNASEEYDGTSWTAGNDVTYTSQNAGGAGVQTNGIVFGGNTNVTTTSGYNGTNWSARPAMGTGRDYLSGAGTAAAALGFGGNAPGDAGLVTTEEFTGTVTLKTVTDS